MLVYDIEIVKAVPVKHEERMEDVEYCAGWHDHANMGVSVIGAYDYEEDRYRVFFEDNFDQFQELLEAHDELVTFNGVRFDDAVLAVNGFTIPSVRKYDILLEVWSALGLGLERFTRAHGGLGLDPLARANFPGTGKTGNGAMAPALWQRGRRGEVVDYCLNDVRLTKMLRDKILRHGALINPKDHQRPILISEERVE